MGLCACYCFADPRADSRNTKIIATVAGLVYICAWIDFLAKWAAVYAPPDLLGSYFGLVFSAAGILQLIVNLTVPNVARDYYGPTNPMQFTVVFIIFGSISTLASLGLLAVIWRNGVPETPPMPRSRTPALSVQ
jgi:hypothetical protein